MAVVDADYATVINTMRSHLANGTQPNATDMKLAIAVVQDGVSRYGTSNTATTAAKDAITTARAALVVLDATACAANAGADAAAVIVTQCAALATQITALNTAQISVPTYTASTGADG